MEEFITKALEALPLVLQVIGGLAVAATAAVRIVPKSSNIESADGIVDKIFKFISYLPTIGINPRTKQLEDAVKEIRSK